MRSRISLVVALVMVAPAPAQVLDKQKLSTPRRSGTTATGLVQGQHPLFESPDADLDTTTITAGNWSPSTSPTARRTAAIVHRVH